VMRRIASRSLEEEPNPAVVPVVVVQASPEDVGSQARLDFYRQVLNQLRGHVAVRDRMLSLPLASVRGKKSTDSVEWLEMRDAVSYALDLLGVKAVCIDEAQHLMYADATQKPWIQLDWRKLAHQPEQPALHSDWELLSLRFLSLERVDRPAHA
jgi:hypothetical protein